MNEVPLSYAKHYSSKALIALLPRLLSKTGMDLMAKIVQLYYVARSPDVPGWVKASVCAGLGYLIVVPDAVPDITPLVGFLDDIAVLSTVFTTVAAHISPKVKGQADAKLAELFPTTAINNSANDSAQTQANKTQGDETQHKT